MLAVLRAQSPATKLATLDAMWRSAVQFVRSGVIAQHPDWNADEVAAETARRMTISTDAPERC